MSDYRQSMTGAMTTKINEHCPACGEQTLVIEQRLETKEPGTFSLSGQSMKVVARRWPWVRCTNCGVEARGEWEPK